MNDKSLGQIAAEAAGYMRWKDLPASVRAEWQKGAEAVFRHVQKECLEVAREVELRAFSIQRKKP